MFRRASGSVVVGYFTPLGRGADARVRRGSPLSGGGTVGAETVGLCNKIWMGPGVRVTVMGTLRRICVSLRVEKGVMLAIMIWLPTEWLSLCSRGY